MFVFEIDWQNDPAEFHRRLFDALEDVSRDERETFVSVTSEQRGARLWRRIECGSQSLAARLEISLETPCTSLSGEAQ